MIEKEKVIELLKGVKAESYDHKIRLGIDRCIDAIEQMQEEGDDGR